MLTKQDLSQIKTILQTELNPINKKLIEHDKKFDKIDTQFKVVNKKLNKLQKDLDVTIDFFDDTRLKHLQQIERIESHLGLPTPTYI